VTQDEIIETAVKAGMQIDVLTLGRNVDLLESFAKLVAQHERSECLKFCEQVAEYFPSSGFVGSYIGNKIREREKT